MNNTQKSEIIVDDSGIIEFINLFSVRDGDLREKIEKLFNTSSYQRLVELGGPNIGIYKKDLWIETFKNTIENSENIVDNIFMRNITKTIRYAFDNLDKIEKLNNYLKNIINTKDFLKIAKQFVPKEIEIDKIRINMVIFMPNAFGINDDMIVDLFLLGNANKDYINGILAHELHHMLRSKVAIEFLVEEKYSDIAQALYWLESEGIADLCNFEATKNLYEEYGYAEKGKMEYILNNINEYLKKFNNLMFSKSMNNSKDEELIDFLSSNSAFHPIGYYMANKINQILGTEILIQCVGNPVKFITTYQQAAELDGDNSFILDIELIENLSFKFTLLMI